MVLGQGFVAGKYFRKHEADPARDGWHFRGRCGKLWPSGGGADLA